MATRLSLCATAPPRQKFSSFLKAVEHNVTLPTQQLTILVDNQASMNLQQNPKSSKFNCPQKSSKLTSSHPYMATAQDYRYIVVRAKRKKRSTASQITIRFSAITGTRTSWKAEKDSLQSQLVKPQFDSLQSLALGHLGKLERILCNHSKSNHNSILRNHWHSDILESWKGFSAITASQTTIRFSAITGTRTSWKAGKDSLQSQLIKPQFDSPQSLALVHPGKLP
ncbi:hypothetical protein AVEN_242245-1 [Araneus ventricosus]|uniref:Uncharacterized protein n=1 Tax=Araneus ventricosus TaxID=182803 RepID=A0A4Y2LCB6_ARAVE|nr:hypothetical protein AVEN_242245-1 [Araneus ventricosus]